MKPLTILVVAIALGAGVGVAREDGEEPGAGEAVTDLHQVTADSGIDAMPSWTPDGRRIVFAATGVTDGSLMKGVRFFGAGTRTVTLVMQTHPHRIRFVDSIHLAENADSGVKIRF